MKIKHLKSIIFFVLLWPFTSCHVGMPHEDISIVNCTRDSLYYEFFPYKAVKFPMRNPAFEKFTDLKTNKVGYDLLSPDLLPDSIDHGFLIDTMENVCRKASWHYTTAF